MDLDRDTARALTEAGYMPLAQYIELIEHDDQDSAEAPSIMPGQEEHDLEESVHH